MYVLCDTSSVLMLLRIAPAMFADSRFECVMTQTVYREYVQTKKFKKKYPWRTQYQKHLRSVPDPNLTALGVEKKHQMVRSLNQALIRESKNRPYGLSPADERIAAETLCLGGGITTGDENLAAFLDDQFDIECVSPLGIVNAWLEKELIEWTDARQAVIDDWIAQNEHDQPPDEIDQFEKLTGWDYPQ